MWILPAQNAVAVTFLPSSLLRVTGGHLKTYSRCRFLPRVLTASLIRRGMRRLINLWRGLEANTGNGHDQVDRELRAACGTLMRTRGSDRRLRALELAELIMRKTVSDYDGGFVG